MSFYQKGFKAMANIFEYIGWRGDIPFSVSEFNEVDNLILSQICYTDFESIMTADDDMTLSEVARIYFEVHSAQEVLEQNTFYKMAPMVMKSAGESERFGNIKIRHYINFTSTLREEQYAAITYVLPDGTNYVAFRGTDNTIIGWKEDFNLSFMSETAGQKRAVEYVDYYFSGGNEKLILGGHSKGGNFAVYAGAFCKQEIQDRIINVYSNDGPGFRDEILERDGYKRILPKVISIIPEESLVGVLLANEFENHIVKSSAKGINQHNPMTWKVYGKRFVEIERRSEVSRIIDKTVRKVLEGLSAEDRASIIDAVFEGIDSAGVKTLNDISEGGLKHISDFMKYIKELPEEKQQEFSAVVKNLIKSGSEIMMNEVKKNTGISKVEIPRLDVKKLGQSAPFVAKLETKLETFDEKKVMRQKLQNIRKNMTETEVYIKSEQICDAILGLDEYEESDIILAYMSQGNEVNLMEVIRQAVKDRKRVFIPKVEDKKTMEFYIYDGKTIIGSYGIREPANTGEKTLYDPELERMLDKNRKTLILIPGVGYDQKKNRIGQGGGYYDRYLERLEGYLVHKVAVGYEFQIVDSIPIDKYDITPDLIVTEERIIR